MAQTQLLMMRILPILTICFFVQACTVELSPEQKEHVAHLQQDLERIHKDIEQAKQDDAAYTGGLIKTLVAVRLEVLKTNEALVEQQIDPPHLPRGAVPQAWGVAEVLRVWRQLDV